MSNLNNSRQAHKILFEYIRELCTENHGGSPLKGCVRCETKISAAVPAEQKTAAQDSIQDNVLWTQTSNVVSIKKAKSAAKDHPVFSK